MENKKSKITTLLGFAARARKITFGITALEIGLKRGKVRVLILDKNAKENTRKRILHLSRKYDVPWILYDDERTLDRVVGKANCRCVGVLDNQFAKEMLKAGKQV